MNEDRPRPGFHERQQRDRDTNAAIAVLKARRDEALEDADYKAAAVYDEAVSLLTVTL